MREAHYRKWVLNGFVGKTSATPGVAIYRDAQFKQRGDEVRRALAAIKADSQSAGRHAARDDSRPRPLR